MTVEGETPDTQKIFEKIAIKKFSMQAVGRKVSLFLATTQGLSRRRPGRKWIGGEKGKRESRFPVKNPYGQVSTSISLSSKGMKKVPEDIGKERAWNISQSPENAI